MPAPKTCRNCGRAIMWANGPRGPLALDPRPRQNVYRLIQAEGDESVDPSAIRIVYFGQDEGLERIADALKFDGPHYPGGISKDALIINEIDNILGRIARTPPSRLYTAHSCQNVL